MEKFAVVEKHFSYKGHDCICVFNCMGFRCGYVSTKHVVSYSEVVIDCHSGRTFGDVLFKEYEPKEVFYLGFDCGHFSDGVDPGLAYKYGLINEQERDGAMEAFHYLKGLPVRSLEYVENELKKIVDQLEEKSNEKKNHF